MYLSDLLDSSINSVSSFEAGFLNSDFILEATALSLLDNDEDCDEALFSSFFVCCLYDGT